MKRKKGKRKQTTKNKSREAKTEERKKNTET